jgi:hypothetical protein
MNTDTAINKFGMEQQFQNSWNYLYNIPAICADTSHDSRKWFLQIIHESVVLLQSGSNTDACTKD